MVGQQEAGRASKGLETRLGTERTASVVRNKGINALILFVILSVNVLVPGVHMNDR